MHWRVPLRTGRVVCAVAWAVSEGSDRRLLLWEMVTLVNSEICRREYKWMKAIMDGSDYRSQLSTSLESYLRASIQVKSIDYTSPY